MGQYSQHSLRKALKNQLRRLDDKIDLLQKWENRVSLLRLLAFVGGLAIVYLAGVFGSQWLFWTSIVLFIGGFSWLIKYHRMVEHLKEKMTLWKSIRSAHLSRQELDWENIPEKHLSKAYNDHPFANDLDLTGSHSLLQLIDNASYQGSTDRLGEYLLKHEPEIQKSTVRQSIIKELKPKAKFRDTLHLLSIQNQEQKLENDWTIERLLNYLERSERVNYGLSLSVLGSLSLLNIILVILYLAGFIAPYVIFTEVIYLVIYNFNRDKIEGLYDEAYQIEKILKRFNAVLRFLENYDFEPGSALQKFCESFQKNSHSPSNYVKRIIRIASAASSQQSELVWLIINLIVPWDLFFVQKLSRYKSELAPKLSHWISAFYSLEAFSSIANFAWLNPQYRFFALRQSSSSMIEALALGHPLIAEEQKVTNDVTISDNGNILLITGSNMAGKSTFLRTMGINMVLFFAGAPVNADSFSAGPFRIFSSINIVDSLDNGISHFYAEVKRLRKLLELLEDNHPMPLFFMVDEIYRGTNNRERLQGSEAFLQNVSGQNGVGLVSTHDLELASLEESIPQLSNWHFEETIEDGKMNFEYKLKPGPCPTTNALKIMQMEGLPT